MFFHSSRYPLSFMRMPLEDRLGKTWWECWKCHAEGGDDAHT